MGIFKNLLNKVLDTEIPFTPKSDETIKADGVVNDPHFFLMKVDDVFTIAGKGTVVTGKITAGSIMLNDEVILIGGNQEIKSKVTGIEKFNRLLNKAKAGDEIGLLLDKIAQNDVKKGYTVTVKENPEKAHIATMPTHSNATRKRMEEAKLKLYVWSTCGDERVCDACKIMDEKLCRWESPNVFSEDGGKTWKRRPKGAIMMHPGENKGCGCRCTSMAYHPELVGEI